MMSHDHPGARRPGRRQSDSWHVFRRRAGFAATIPLLLLSGTLIVPAAGSTADPGAQQSSPAHIPIGRQLSVLFNDQIPAAGDFRTFRNSGFAHLSITVVTADGGELVRRPSRMHNRIDGAVRMPHLGTTYDAPRAVIQVEDTTGADNLNPGAAAFTFGADVTLDKASESTGSTDNGNNLMQRGLFDGPTQYKLQLDDRVPTCRVKGSAGMVEVSSPVTIVAGRWYRIRCQRTANAVSITVTRWRKDGRAVSTRSISRGSTGSLQPGIRSMPLSIGGKLMTQGDLATSTDQFNGRIDNAMLQISAS